MHLLACVRPVRVCDCRSSNREIIDLPQGLFGTASTTAADPKAIVKRRAHGILMAVNFILVFPLGALAARQLRSHWLASPAIRAAMFYVHIITQVCVGTRGSLSGSLCTQQFHVAHASTIKVVLSCGEVLTLMCAYLPCALSLTSHAGGWHSLCNRRLHHCNKYIQRALRPGSVSPRCDWHRDAGACVQPGVCEGRSVGGVG